MRLEYADEVVDVAVPAQLADFGYRLAGVDEQVFRDGQAVQYQVVAERVTRDTAEYAGQVVFADEVPGGKLLQRDVLMGVLGDVPLRFGDDARGVVHRVHRESAAGEPVQADQHVGDKKRQAQRPERLLLGCFGHHGIQHLPDAACRFVVQRDGMRKALGPLQQYGQQRRVLQHLVGIVLRQGYHIALIGGLGDGDRMFFQVAEEHDGVSGCVVGFAAGVDADAAVRDEDYFVHIMKMCVRGGEVWGFAIINVNFAGRIAFHIHECTPLSAKYANY